MYSCRENDEVDRAVVVVVAADKAIGELVNVDERTVRNLSDYFVLIHLEQNEHSNSTLDDLSAYSCASLFDSFDVDKTVDENGDNLYTDNIHNNFEIHTAILFANNYDIHALLWYVSARLHYGDTDHCRITTRISLLDTTLAKTY